MGLASVLLLATASAQSAGGEAHTPRAQSSETRFAKADGDTDSSASNADGSQPNDLLMPVGSDASEPSASSKPSAASFESLAAHIAKRREERASLVPRTPPNPDVLRRYDDQLATNRSAENAFVAGLNMFLWPYGLSAIVGGLALEIGDKKLAQWGLLTVPLVGPFILAAAGERLVDVERGFLIADGALQAVGLITILGAITIQRNAENRMKYAAQAEPPAFSLRITPTASANGGGIGISGSF